MGWYSDKQLTRKARKLIGKPSKAKRRVYARWSIRTYRISYELDGGFETLSLPREYTVESSAIKPYTPTKYGCRFEGWFEDSGFSIPRPSISRGSTGNVTLYAKWKPVDYWEDHLSVKIACANDISDSAEKPLPSFVYITDMHIPNNELVSPGLVNRVIEETKANMVFFGGDAINFNKNKAVAIQILKYVRRCFGDVDVHFVRGNHDGNINSSNALPEHEIPDTEFVRITTANEEVRDASDQVYYYIDDDVNKVRYIVLDSGADDPRYVSEEQIRIDEEHPGWLQQRILELDESWTVLVFVHQYFYGSTVDPEGILKLKYDVNGLMVKSALNSIYSDAQAHIAGVITGHCHKDHFEYSFSDEDTGDSWGYPIVSTTCDAYKREKTNSARMSGDITEQAFDIVTIDTIAKKIYFTRVGAGEDREFDYDVEQPIHDGHDEADDEDAEGSQEEPGVDESEQALESKLQALRSAGFTI